MGPFCETCSPGIAARPGWCGVSTLGEGGFRLKGTDSALGSGRPAFLTRDALSALTKQDRTLSRQRGNFLALWMGSKVTVFCFPDGKLKKNPFYCTRRRVSHNVFNH